MAEPRSTGVALQGLEARLMLAATPHSPTGQPWAIANNAVSWIEAEDFDNGGEGVGYHDTTAANQGGQYRTSEGVDIEGPSDSTGGTYNVGYVQPTEYLNYTINVATAGSYQLSLRASNANPSAASAHATIGGVSTGAIAIPNTNGWGNYQNFTATVNLAAGTQTLTVRDDTGGFNFDYVSLQPTSTLGGEQAYGTRGLPPLIPQNGQAQIESENYDTGGQNVGYFKTQTNKSSTATFNGQPFRAADLVSTTNSGTGVVTAYWQPNDWTQYTVNATTAGTYELLLNYSRGDTGNSNFAISVNGSTQTTNLTLPSTSDWNGYKTVGTTVNLLAGPNKLKFVTSVGQLNFDYFRLIQSNTFGNNGASYFLPASGTTRIEAENFNTNPGAYLDTTAGNSGNSNYRPGTDVDLETTTDSTGAVDVTNFSAGEYMNYTVRPDSTGAYNLSLRVLAPNGGSIKAYFDSGAGFDSSTNPDMLTYTAAAAASSSWQTITIPVLFKSGLQTLRVQAATGGVAINWFELAKNTTTAISKPDSTQSGNYAAAPPDQALNSVDDLFDRVYVKQYDWINRPTGAAIPTNDWWTQILDAPFAGGMWAYPQQLQDAAGGVSVNTYPTVNTTAGNVAMSGGQKLTIGDASGTAFTKDSLLDYGDWTVHYRMLQAGNNSIDVTMGRGIPYTWFEFNGITPTITAGGAATAFDAAGNALGATFTTDQFRLSIGGQQFGIFAPAGTTFTLANGKYTAAFSGASKYLVVAALPDATSATMATFYQHAYAIPRAVGNTSSSTYTYTYDAAAGQVATHWNLNTVALRAGASLDTIQGWLPQNYEGTAASPTMIAGATYPSIEGTLKIAIGQTFTVTQPSLGLSFLLPTPQSIGGTSDYSVAQMKIYLQTLIKQRTDAAATAAAGKTILTYGNDTYFGGKQPQEYAEAAMMAKQIGDTADYNILLDNLRSIMTDWLTYTPGETSHYFAWYPDSKALIGFSPSFGSENFTDNMFHYGYFTASAGVLSMLDPAWASQYGAMAKMIAMQYANWLRPTNTSDATSLPYFRTFEFWSGHSYAGGTGDARGNNEESSSEAIQSWMGLALLGQALGDSAMTAAGMMGYTVESKAVQYQWFDSKQETFQAAGAGYNRSNVAINYDDSKGYGTFFGANPEYILGIESLPLWPDLDYLGQYPTVARQATAEMLAQRAVFYNDATKNTFASFEDGTNVNDWLNVDLGFQSLYDPQATADEYARMISQGTPTGKDGTTGLYYYQDQSLRTYGLRDYGYHLSLPLGGVYTHAADSTTMANTRTYIVYNPAATSQTVNVYDSTGAIVDSFLAAAQTTTTITRSTLVQPPPPPTTDVALGKAAVSSSNENGANVASLATDGKSSTRWSSAYADPQWIYVDLGQTYNVSEVKLNWETAAGKDYLIQISSDATNWTTIKTVTGNTTSGVHDYTGLSGQGRYVRVYGTARTTKYGYSLYDFNVFGTAVGAAPVDIAQGKTATSSSKENNTNIASAAFDNNGSTRWSSAYSDPQWITVDLGQNYSINEIKLNWETAAGKDYLLQVSADNTSWTTMQTITGNTTAGIHTYTNLSGVGRYVRLYGTARTTNYGYSLWDFNVYGTATGDSSTTTPPTPGTTILSRTGWIATASSTEGGGSTTNALDGSLTTRWSNGRAMVGGEYYQIDLGAATTFDRVVLDSGNSANDYARGYQILISNNGTDWATQSPIASGTGASATIDASFSTVTARYLRVVQTGAASNWWSISEANLYV